MAKVAKSLEESFDQLNHIIHGLEKEDLGLEESFQLYHDGMKLLKECNDSIDKVEKKLIILSDKDLVEET
jgi:exodeoxyribonuclease VII small subunit